MKKTIIIVTSLIFISILLIFSYKFLKDDKEIMTKNPISVEKDILAAKALSIMNSKKITSLSVYDKRNKSKVIGIVHIHNILQSNIS